MSGYDYSGYYGQGAPPAADYAAQPYGAAQYGAGPYQPAPYAHYGAPGYAAAAGSDEVRTIFITGFPADVKERELNNMLRFMTGYEASQMNWKNGAAQGFALFATPALARAACDAITQLQFDEAATLRCEMARKNMYIKDMEPVSKRARTGNTTYAPVAAGGYGAPSGGGSYSAPRAYGSSTNMGDNPPCNTLFVGNLSETVNEAELNSIFAPLQGFRQLKVVRGRNTTAFVEFDTIENATKVHNTQQGVMLASNQERGGLRIQYSRNPFGKKRDFTGAAVGAPDIPGVGV